MHVTINGEPRDIPDGSTLADLLVLLDLDKAICAAEINKAVVPRAERDTRTLAEGDAIELVTLVGGG